MKTLRVVRQKTPKLSDSRRMRPCVVVNTRLETGERVRRGCGYRGMVACDVGWRCLYCGNTVYFSAPSLGSLWFHFKVGREYWKATHRHAQDYVNGIPVDSPVERIPGRLLSDLDEPLAPDWFFYYVFYDEERFLKYLEARRDGKVRYFSSQGTPGGS